jgi:RNA polymerase sigma factor (sigma-70 family)
LQSQDQTLARLMALAQNGDAVAYRTVLEESRRWLLRYFSKRIAPSGIDDLVQDTLISIHAKRASYDPARPYLPWLGAIARYRWVDQLRRIYRQDEAELEDVHGVEPEDEAIMARISIDRMLAILPDGQAAAIKLVKIDGLSIAEASAACGQSEALIKVNIHRGLKKLSASIESA